MAERIIIDSTCVSGGVVTSMNGRTSLRDFQREMEKIAEQMSKAAVEDDPKAFRTFHGERVLGPPHVLAAVDKMRKLGFEFDSDFYSMLQIDSEDFLSAPDIPEESAGPLDNVDDDDDDYEEFEGEYDEDCEYASSGREYVRIDNDYYDRY